jgi:hypothetical protein
MQDEKKGALLIIIIIIIIINCPTYFSQNFKLASTMYVSHTLYNKRPNGCIYFAFHLLFYSYNFKIFHSVTPTRSLRPRYIIEMRTLILANSRTSTKAKKKKIRSHVKILGARNVTWGKMLKTPIRSHSTIFSRPKFVPSWCSVKKYTVVAFHPKQQSTSFRRLGFPAFHDTLVGSAATRNITLATR